LDEGFSTIECQDKGGGFNELTIMLVDSLTTFGDYQMGIWIQN